MKRSWFTESRIEAILKGEEGGATMIEQTPAALSGSLVGR